jgi:hypothetical protein
MIYSVAVRESINVPNSMELSSSWEAASRSESQRSILWWRVFDTKIGTHDWYKPTAKSLPLMMGTETTSEVSDTSPTLTQLSARNDFIAYCDGKCYKSYSYMSLWPREGHTGRKCVRQCTLPDTYRRELDQHLSIWAF